MKIKPYITKLSSSKEYKAFQKKYEDAFMIAGFFIIDLETQNNLHQIDYYVPSEKKIAAFTVDKGVTMQMLDMINNKLVPEKMDMRTNIDLDALKGILEDEMKNRSITEEIKKIIAIVQTIDGKKVWNLNCVLSGMGILKAHVDDESQTVLKMEKSSILDYIKKLPANIQSKMGMSGVPGAPGAPKAQPAMQDVEDEVSPEGTEDLNEKLKNLNKLEEEIEKEKVEIEKEVIAKASKKRTAKPASKKKAE